MVSEIARETLNWFCNQSNEAIFPLFSLVELVQELPYFKDLPFKIEDQALPLTAMTVSSHIEM